MAIEDFAYVTFFKVSVNSIAYLIKTPAAVYLAFGTYVLALSSSSLLKIVIIKVMILIFKYINNIMETLQHFLNY